MNMKYTRWLAVAAIALVGVCVAPSVPTGAQVPTETASLPAQPPPQLASVEQLKSDAFKALRLGKFDVGNDLLARAVSASNDPQLARMHEWTSQFDSQLKTFAQERRKAFEKAVGKVQLLIKNGHGDYALDFARSAQLLSDDKKAFHDEPWVKQLIADSIAHADIYQASEQWLKALRIYSDLASIEPASKEWKDKLKGVTRRVRLLALYTPERLKAVQETESKERDEVDALLNPTTQPVTKPVKDPAVANDNFRLDWRETLRGVRLPMLMTAMHETCNNYYRDVNYKGLLAGGLQGLEALITTRGLETAFPTLHDQAKREAFGRFLNQWKDAATAATPADEQELIDRLLSDGRDGLLAVNNETIRLPEEVLVSEFADGALGGLDPFTSMIWPNEMDEFNKSTQGEFTGVGIQIKLENMSDLKVVSPLEDTPAYRSGIKADDLITHINGKSAKGINLNQAVKTITGPAGTTVRLTVKSPNGNVKEYTIRRETIKVASVKGYRHRPGGGWDYFIDEPNKIAYLRVTQFTRSTSDELSRALDEVGPNVQGLILDLRHNPGGLLNAAMEVSDKFLNDGVIVSTHADRETPNGPTIATAKADDNEFRKRVVVLVNQYSASASEIVSGALKDDHRAIIVGERTFGKGSVQMLFSLANRSAFLKLTTSHYYLPSGRCIHREENSTEWGVDPDVTVEMTPEQMQAAQDAREDLDVLRDVNPSPAKGDDQKVKDLAVAAAGAPDDAQNIPPTTQKTKKDLLAQDAQLSAALLVLRLQTLGAHL